MTDAPDADLLERFVRENSEAAFAALVERHISLVHSVALRHTTSPQHAQDITQAVFIILARKAAALSGKTILPGWLYNTARLTAANFQRAENRRTRREQEAYMQSMFDEIDSSCPSETETNALWAEMSPLLDDAMSRLGARDRDALVLRYFQNKSLAQVGATMGLKEQAAQKCVTRAIEKLRKVFAKNGVTLTATAIAGAVSANSIQAAPMTLMKTISAVAIAKGAAATASTLTLVKGALKIMAWSKVKTAVVTGIVVLFAAGTTTVAVNEIQETKETIQDHETYSWEVASLDPGMGAMKILRETTPQVLIVDSKYDHFVGNFTQGDTTKYDKSGKLISVTTNASQSIGIGVTLDSIVETAYGSEPLRTIFSVEIPKRKYDYIANLPHNALTELQAEIKEKFDMIGRWEMVKTNVLAIRFAGQESEFTNRAILYDPRNSFTNRLKLTLDSLKTSLQGMVSRDIPVVDQTGLTNQYPLSTNTYLFSFAWPLGNISSDARKQATSDALRDQLGLELVPTNMPIEMLVVEKVK